ncbi:MAG: hypothetical protein A2381_02210 [Bdellovibrionales bacterium RIFOXYB1_FULL_37_110]|nr:MAG: hypothetical protein A2417_13515 [Bdellovibrionales bacterium RIFOXYC1_FULL_37_79]OFZ59252.1 MAG: hypothetical protein A2381_02210 [Bdellovibrionales bacterium RIFOXYB1_FULL_37_110]OFZ62878.1 MAG: hypothetical protein A2577_11165 [Bdellovibrionales bacterium RIFOXYD1_FULL_36_51]
MSTTKSSEVYADCSRLIVSTTNPLDYRINLDLVFKKIENFKHQYGAQIHTKILGQSDGEPVYRIDLPGHGPLKKKKVVLTAGIHGNEPIGVEVVLSIIDQLVHNTKLRNEYDFIFFPTLNPGGLRNNKRFTNDLVEMNATFVKGQEGKVALMIKNSMQPEEEIYKALDLHEAVSQNGFFFISSNQNDDALLKRVVAEIPKEYVLRSSDNVYPQSLRSVSDPAKIAYILKAPGEAISLNPGTMKDYWSEVFKAKDSYTVESPKKLDYKTKKEIYMKAVQSFLNNL